MDIKKLGVCVKLGGYWGEFTKAKKHNVCACGCIHFMATMTMMGGFLMQ